MEKNTSIFNFKNNTKEIKEVFSAGRFVFAVFCTGYFLLLFFWLCAQGSDSLGRIGWLALFVIAAAHKRFRREYFLIFISGIVFLGIGEVYFRFHYFGPESLKGFKRYAAANLWSPFSDVPYDRNSFTGLKPQSFCIFKGREFYINNYGFHDRDWTAKKEREVVRIMVCGTSVSMGSGVKLGENYSKQLESLLNGNHPGKQHEILNFSMAGYNIRQIAYLLDRHLALFDPDVILVESGGWIFNRSTADFKPEVEKFAGPAIQAILTNPSDLLFFAQAITNELPPYVNRSLYSFKKRLGLTEEYPASFKSDLSPFPMDETEIRGYFERIKNLAGKRKVIFLGLRPLREGSLFESELKWHELTKTIGKEYGFDFIDAVDGNYGMHLKEMIIYPGDNHPNARTHHIYAQLIFKDLCKPIEDLLQHKIQGSAQDR